MQLYQARTNNGRYTQVFPAMLRAPAFDAPRASRPPLRRESSEASRGGKRRNSHHSAVFSEAGNGAVMGISELAEMERFELPRAF